MNGHLLWFRLWSEAVDDEKLRLLAYEDRWHFIAILCCKAQGLLDNPGDLMQRKVSVKLGLQVRELDEVARRLAEVGLVDAETLQPIAWESRQCPSDRSTERVRAWRAKRNVSETLHERCETAPEAEAEAEDISITAAQQNTDASRSPSQSQHTEQSSRFDAFWTAYPRKVAKQQAAKVWKTAKLDIIADLIVADVTRRRIDDPQWRDPQYIPHPTTYLRQRRWEDEIVTADQKSAEPQRRRLSDALAN